MARSADTSDAQLRSLLTDAPVGIALLDASLHFVQANERFLAETAAASLLGRSLREAAPGLADQLEPSCRRVLETGAGVGPFEIHGRIADTAPARSWLVSLFPVHGGDGRVEGVGGVARDITEQRAAEEALRSLLEAERQTRLRAEEAERSAEELLARVTDGFVALDRDFNYSYVNAQGASMLGRTPEALIGRNYYVEFPDAVGTPFEQAYVRAMHDQEPIVLEDYYEPWDRWFENRIFPSPGGLSIFFSEITDRKRLERALRKRNERLQVLHDLDREILRARSEPEISEVVLGYLQAVAPSRWSGVVLVRGTDLRVVAQQPPIADPRVEVAQAGPLREWLRSIPPDRTFAVDDSLPQAARPIVDWLAAADLAHGVAVPVCDDPAVAIGLLCLADGEERVFAEDHLVALREVAGQLSIALRQAELRDRLERHAAELDAIVAERTAALEDRNAELESFSYTVSHDLRAPLRALQGFSQALLEDNADQLDAMGREYVQRIARAANRLDLLIQDLLAYSRLSRADLSMTRVDLEVAVREALAQLDAELRERHAEVIVVAPLPVVRAHRATLIQVIANLISNAAKFVAPGVEPRIVVHAEPAGAMIRCSIDDNGIGIAVEHRDRIFRVFERLHGAEAYPGTGVGLAIVRKGCERMGGRAGIEPRAEGGSRFWIELPQAEEQ